MVDDEQDLCEILCYNLSAQGFLAEPAHSAEEALDKLGGSAPYAMDYDLLLLDVMMPGMSGFELVGRLKQDEQTSHIPIIFLTAKDSEDDMLQGFGLGADDYVKKPFSVKEVMARVKVVLGRSHAQAPQAGRGMACFEGLTVDLDKKVATADGVVLPLTKTELELLALLLTHRGQVLSRQQVLDSVWPQDVIVSDRAVDVNITRLRKKIGRYSRYVVSRQGFGYVFES